MEIEFSEDVNMSMLNSSTVQINVEQEGGILSLNFTLEPTNGRILVVHLVFSEASLISPNIVQDQIVVSFSEWVAVTLHKDSHILR